MDIHVINSSLEIINNFLKTEIENLCEKYEEKLERLEEINKKLEQSLADSQQKLLLMESTIEQLKEKNNFNISTTSEKPNQYPNDNKNKNSGYEDLFIKAKRIDSLTSKEFTVLMNQMNSEIMNTDNNFVISSILNFYNAITSDKKLNILKNSFKFSGYKATEQLLANPSCFIEKIKFLSTLKLLNYQKRYIHELLTTYAPLLKNTLNDKELTYLFWYAYLFNYENLFLEQFNNQPNWSAQSNPLTKLYFKQIKMEDVTKYVEDLRLLLTNMEIFKNSDIDIIKNKLLKRNLVISTKTNEKAKNTDEPPLINSIYVIKESDRFKFIDTFALTPSTISVNFVDKSNPKKNYTDTIQALVDSKNSKAYITEKDLVSYKEKFSPLHLKISGYPDFKWPSTDISDSSTLGGHTLLQQESNLKSLGYHHELDKNTRWDILGKAVRQFGLKNVAYTLAHNTKRLKGRKPDSVAISIWETDLNRLKTKFYRNQFQWPTTKL